MAPVSTQCVLSIMIWAAAVLGAGAKVTFDTNFVPVAVAENTRGVLLLNLPPARESGGNFILYTLQSSPEAGNVSGFSTVDASVFVKSICGPFWSTSLCCAFIRFPDFMLTQHPLLFFLSKQFTLIGTALWATASASVDFETWTTTFTLIVQAANAANATDTALLYISITILNVNDAPIISSGTTVSVPENTANGTVVYTLTFTDQDVGDTHVLALRDSSGPSNNNNGVPAFRFDAATRTLRVNSLLNFEAGPTVYQLNLTVTDAGTAFYPAITSFLLLAVAITGTRPCA